MGEKIENGTYVREYYQVPAHKGRPVIWRGRGARIVGFDGAYLRLKLLDVSPLDDESDEVVVNPRWEVEYPDLPTPEDPEPVEGKAEEEPEMPEDELAARREREAEDQGSLDQHRVA